MIVQHGLVVAEWGDTTATAYERVDARAVEVGNKDDQVARYGDHHPGWQCWLEPGQ